LLLQPLRDAYGKGVDGVNWDILNAGNRTGSGSGATMTGAAATGRGQDLPLRHAHLVRLPPVRLQIDNRSPSGPWNHRKPANMTDRDHWSCIWPWARIAMPVSVGEE
jgi:hypothetical protein